MNKFTILSQDFKFRGNYIKKIILALLVGIFCSPFIYANCPDPSKIDVKNPTKGIQNEDGLWSFIQINLYPKKLVFLAAYANRLDAFSLQNPLSHKVICVYVDPASSNAQVAFSSPASKSYKIDISSGHWTPDHRNFKCIGFYSGQPVSDCPFRVNSSK